MKEILRRSEVAQEAESLVHQFLLWPKVEELLWRGGHPAVCVEDAFTDLHRETINKSIYTYRITFHLRDFTGTREPVGCKSSWLTFHSGTSFMITASSSRFSRSIFKVLKQRTGALRHKRQTEAFELRFSCAASPSVLLCLHQRHQRYPGFHLLNLQASAAQNRTWLWAPAQLSPINRRIQLKDIIHKVSCLLSLFHLKSLQ